MSLHVSEVAVTPLLPSPSLSSPLCVTPGHSRVLWDCGGQMSSGSAEAASTGPLAARQSGGGMRPLRNLLCSGFFGPFLSLVTAFIGCLSEFILQVRFPETASFTDVTLSGGQMVRSGGGVLSQVWRRTQDHNHQGQRPVQEHTICT